MKTILWVVGIIVVVSIVYYFFNHLVTPMEEQQTVTVTPIGHATAVISIAGKTIYTDPTGGATAFIGQPTAEVVLVTDIHGDHLSTTTLEAVLGNASLVVPQAVYDLLPQNLAARATVLPNGQTTNQAGLTITAVPMYNLPESPDSRHTKGRGNGYLVEAGGNRLYVAGDTAGIPEMRTLTNIDVALVPMNLPFTMGVDEAADAVLDFAPRQVYPYHYRGQDGLADVERFKTLVNEKGTAIEVVLLDWYPQM
jgi:L-ascorbate metabolism protein UlaG (beta-lactamase superfamily)